MAKERFSLFSISGRSIQGKIFFAFTSVFIVAFVLVNGIWYLKAQDTVSRHAADAVTRNFSNVNESLDLLLKDIDKINLAIVTSNVNVVDTINNQHYPSLEWFDNLRRINNFLTSFYTVKQEVISGVGVIGMSGNQYKAGTPLLDPAFFDSHFGRSVVAARGQSVVELRSDTAGAPRGTGERSIISTGRAIVQNGTVLGVGFADIKPTFIQNVFGINVPEGGFILVKDRDGNIVYTSDSQSVRKLDRVAVDGESRARELVWERKKYLAVTYHFGSTGWDALYMTPKAALVSDFNATGFQMLAISLCLFAVILAASVAVSNQITKNLKKLHVAMKKVGRGELVSLPAVHTSDEIGDFSRVFSRMVQDIQQLMDNIREKENQKRIVEFRHLQSQISPHFLYNTLNTIRFLAQLQGSPAIDEVSTSLIDLLRAVVGKDDRFITFREELELTRSYINIQRYRFLRELHVNYQVEEAVLEYKTLRMLMQPLVENAIIHGMGSGDRDGILSVRASLEENLIRISITDNGAGMTPEQIEKIHGNLSGNGTDGFSGIGIGNVSERIRLYFGEGYGLKYVSHPGLFTTAEMTVPAIREDNDAARNDR